MRTSAAVNTELANLPFEVRRAQSQLEFAEKDYDGKNSAQGSVSARAVNEAKSMFDTSRATVEELHSRANDTCRTANGAHRTARRT